MEARRQLNIAPDTVRGKCTAHAGSVPGAAAGHHPEQTDSRIVLHSHISDDLADAACKEMQASGHSSVKDGHMQCMDTLL